MQNTVSTMGRIEMEGKIMKRNIKKTINIFLLAIMLLANFTIIANAYAGQTVFTNQNTTADSKPTGARGANGTVMEVGYCAVHPTYVGQRTNPIFNFGTIMYIDAFDGVEGDLIPHPWGELGALNVQDIGDINYVKSKYWLDIYWGPSETMYDSAMEYGINHTVSYHSSEGAKR